MNGDLAEFGLRRDFVAKTDGVIKNPKPNGDDAFVVFVFGKVVGDFGVIIVNVVVFAPRQFDGLGVLFPLFANEFEIVA